MKKRIIYSLLIILLLMTTVLQSLGTVFAAATANNSSETTSKIIDTSKSIAQVSESSQLRSSSQNVVQSSSTSQKKESKKSSSSNSTGKSVMQSASLSAADDTGLTFHQGKLALGGGNYLAYTNGTNYDGIRGKTPTITDQSISYANFVAGKVQGVPITKTLMEHAGRNNIGLWAQGAKDFGQYTRWMSIHKDDVNKFDIDLGAGTPIAPNQADLSFTNLSSSTTLLFGLEADNAIGTSGTIKVTASSLEAQGTILKQTLEYTRTVGGIATTITDDVTYQPTDWKTVYIKEHITNTSGRDLKGLFFGRTIDTDLRNFWTSDQGSGAIGDKPKLIADGDRGMYEKQDISATEGPTKYQEGNASLFYDFNLFSGSGPDGWQGFNLTNAPTSIPSTFIGKRFATPRAKGDRTTKVNIDTELDMLWWPKDLKQGESRDIGYEVGLNGGGQPSPPEITLNQKPRVMYVDGSQKDVVLDGTVTNKNPTDSADPKYKKMNELIYYEVQHKDASGNVTTGGPKVLTSVADVAAGQTKNYSGLAKGIEDDLHVGDRIVVWAVDSGGMTSVNHEHTDLVERAAEISKKVKNITNGDSSFKTETDYKPGDTVEYQGTLKNLKTKVALPKGAIITDELDSNLTVKGDVTLRLLCQESGHKSTNKFDFQFKLLNLIFGGRSFSPVQILKTL